MTDVITIGAINWDINIWVDNFARVGEEIPVNRITRVPGGKAANVAVAAARIMGSRRVSLFGALGEDEIGREQLTALSNEEVDTSHIKFIKGAESGQAYITIDRNGSNFIETLFGANHEFLPADLLEPLRLSTINGSKVIAISDPLIQTAEKLAELGSKHGATILFDAGTKLDAGLEELEEVLRFTSIFIMNAVESMKLTGSTDPLEVRERLKERELDVGVIVKLGERGCTYASRDDERITQEALPVEKLDLKVVSTVGCGDAFLGVLAASLSEGFPEVEALERASVAGGLKATKPVTRGSPYRQELEEALQVWRKKQ